MSQKIKWIIIVMVCFAPVCGGFVPSVLFAEKAMAVDSTLPLISTPTPTAEVVVLKSSTFAPYEGSKSLYIIGEVRNDTNLNVQFVQITATLYDASGEAVQAKYSYTQIDQLSPGDVSPFLIIFSNPVEWSSYDLNVEWNATPRQRPPLKVLSSELYFDDFGAAHVKGKARNPSGETRKYINAVVTLYGPDGEVIGVGNGYTAPNKLDPNQVTLFDVRVSFWKYKPDMSRVEKYRIQVQGSALADALQPSEAEPIASPSFYSSTPTPDTDTPTPLSLFRWEWVCYGLLGVGALGGVVIFAVRAIYRARLKGHLKDLRSISSRLLNACEPLLRGDAPEETVLYQLYRSYGGEEDARMREDVLRWLRRSRDALGDAFEIRKKLIAPTIQKERTRRQQVHDWEMLYATLVGNEERILSLTESELRTLLDPMVMGRNMEGEGLGEQLEPIRRELSGGPPLRLEWMMIDPNEIEPQGVLGYIGKIKNEIARLRDAV
jgi:hypothetical protein